MSTVSSLPSVLAAMDTLIETASGFYQKNWMLGTSGNLSIRVSEPGEPLALVVTASGKDKGILTRDDFLVVDAQGQPLKCPAEGHKASAETLLHSKLYQMDPAIGAVYHVHTPFSALLSKHALYTDASIDFEGLEMLKGLGFKTHQMKVELPVLPNSQDIAALSEMLPGRIDLSVPGFILQGHGVYTWGKSPFEAKRHVEIWEYLFQYRWQEVLLEGREA